MSLTVLNAEQSIVELDEGDSSSVTACFSANLSESLNRDAVFVLNFLPISTASFGADFLPNTTIVLVPATATGEFITCINFEIVGDDVFEGDEAIVYTIFPQVILDSVMFPGNLSLLTINILDNDDLPGNVCILSTAKF